MTNSVVYFIACNKWIKIGTTKNLRSRMSALQTSAVDDLILLGTINGDAVIERVVHTTLAAYRKRGEWFADCDPVREHINLLCGKDVFAKAPEPPPVPHKIEDVLEDMLFAAQSRMLDLATHCLQETEGEQINLHAPLMRLPVMKRYLIIAALKWAKQAFSESAQKAEFLMFKTESVDWVGRAIANQEMLEGQIQFICGPEDAWFLSGYQFEPRANPLFEVLDGKIRWRTRSEADAAGWTQPANSFHERIRTCLEAA